MPPRPSKMSAFAVPLKNSPLDIPTIVFVAAAQPAVTTRAIVYKTAAKTESLCMPTVPSLKVVDNVPGWKGCAERNSYGHDPRRSKG